MARITGSLTVTATVSDAVATDPAQLGAAIAALLAEIVSIAAVDDAQVEVKRVEIGV